MIQSLNKQLILDWFISSLWRKIQSVYIHQTKDAHICHSFSIRWKSADWHGSQSFSSISITFFPPVICADTLHFHLHYFSMTSFCFHFLLKDLQSEAVPNLRFTNFAALSTHSTLIISLNSLIYWCSFRTETGIYLLIVIIHLMYPLPSLPPKVCSLLALHFHDSSFDYWLEFYGWQQNMRPLIDTHYKNFNVSQTFGFEITSGWIIGWKHFYSGIT